MVEVGGAHECCWKIDGERECFGRAVRLFVAASLWKVEVVSSGEEDLEVWKLCQAARVQMASRCLCTGTACEALADASPSLKVETPVGDRISRW